MPLPTFLQRSPKSADADRRKGGGPGAAEDPGPAHEARTRARRRLMGAVVLLAVGVVAFPILFETQPRPVGVDVPIQTPSSTTAPRGIVPPQPVAVAPLPRVEVPAPTDDGARATVGAASAAVVEPVAQVSPPPPPQAPAVAAGPAPKPAAPASTPATRAAAPAGPAAASSAARPAEAARAQAPADAAAARRPAAAASKPAEDKASDDKSGRFVVQVGAYTEAGALRDARARVEKLGLKTYTQVIETDAGKRTRVRVGPFDERAEAEAAARKLKAAGLPANILAL